MSLSSNLQVLLSDRLIAGVEERSQAHETFNLDVEGPANRLQAVGRSDQSISFDGELFGQSEEMGVSRDELATEDG